ncbi:MAG: hypothetical protein AAB884_01955, partial [Patescibacteria group bacterium]
EWQNQVLPQIAKAVLNTANGEGMTSVLKNLKDDPEILKKLLNLIKESMPGRNEEKLIWLKNKNSSLYVFFVAGPAQELGISLFPVIKPVPENLLFERFASLPSTLKEGVLDYATAEDIFRVSQTNHLPEAKISALASLVGKMLMGFLHLDDLPKEIGGLLGIDRRLAESVAAELDRKIFSRLREEIKEVYDPITVSIEAPIRMEKSKEPSFAPSFTKGYGGQGKATEDKPASAETMTSKEKTISLESLSLPTEPSFAEATEGKEKPIPFAVPKELADSKPLIIHEESSFAKASEDKKKRPSFRGFFPSLGFLKPKDQKPPETRAQIETPNEARGKEKKVVHYSEFRTPVSPFGEEGKFIKTPETETKPPEAAPVLKPPPKGPPWGEPTPPAAPKKFILSNIEENQKNQTGPKLEGNKVDLKNL